MSDEGDLVELIEIVVDLVVELIGPVRQPEHTARVEARVVQRGVGIDLNSPAERSELC